MAAALSSCRCFVLDPKPARWWPVMVMAAAAFLAAQVRAEWLGMAVATVIWGVLSRKMTRVAMIGAGIVAVLAVGALLDVNLPSPGERGGAISSTEIVARGLAAVSPDMARDVTGSDNVNFYSGTINWRKNWWHAIWANSQENYTNLLIGPGYGFPLKNLVNYLKDASRPAYAAQCLLLRSRLQRLDRRIDLLLAAGWVAVSCCGERIR